MTLAQDLTARYQAGLREQSEPLAEEFAAAAEALEPLLKPDELERWAEIGVALSTRSLRSWEAASEFFRASPAVAKLLSYERMEHWATIGGWLSDSSPTVAATYLRVTPEVIEQLPPDPETDPGITGEGMFDTMPSRTDVERWVRGGERLNHSNWKSVALAALYFEYSARLLEQLTLDHLHELVDIIDLLSERSYQLATSCLEDSPALFATLEYPDRRPFLDFAKSLTKSSWADTRLLFERGPQLLKHIHAGERADFLMLAASVVQSSGRQGFPRFMETASALRLVPVAEHGTLIALANRLARRSPAAAMAFLRSSPVVLARLTAEQIPQWVETGARILFEDENIDGAEAYFRLESVRAEQVLSGLSARVELSDIGALLRMYAKALTGAPIAIRSTEDIVDRGIGWVQESMATTEGTSIFLPPFVGSFQDQRENFQAYKVFTTHQTGRIEFGAFGFAFGLAGAHAPATLGAREEALPPRERPALTEMERFYDLFEARGMIAALFTIVEDTRVDATVGREYGGIRPHLKRLQSFEADRRPDIRQLGLRSALAENLLRASLGRRDLMRWPAEHNQVLVDAVRALMVVEERGATVQDSAEVAAALYDIAAALPNVQGSYPDDAWEQPDSAMFGASGQMPVGDGADTDTDGQRPNEEMDFETPDQPEFRGDFKPELVQLLSMLKMQTGASGGSGQQLSREQVMELLQKSTEIGLSEMAEGQVAASVGEFLDNLEKEAAASAKAQQQDDDGEGGDGGGSDEGGSNDVRNEITWTLYDEWDFRASDYRPRWCRVGERLGEEGTLDYYEETLKRHHGLVTETRRQFEMMRPESFRRIKRREDGEEIDLDRSIEFIVDRRAGVGPLAQVYWRRNKVERDVSVTFLMDMSASTDEEIEKHRPQERNSTADYQGDPRNYFQWLAARRAQYSPDPPKRIIDLEKESVVLIVEALEAIGDSYGIYGFSGYGRDNVEFHVIKDLDERFGDRVRKRIDKIQPVRSTRMGPAIRHTVAKMLAHDSKVKILILVSDGRPQDHGYGRDRTEKEYAVHDTHQALIEAKRAGIVPFLITVDKEGHDYMKQLCSDVGYEVVDDIEQLPRRLTSLYRVLAGG